jgi:predicted XRE-type DNA-binding protein
VNASLTRWRFGEGTVRERSRIKFEEGSGNIFADLGFRNADALYSQAKIGFQVLELLTSKSLSEREAATLLGIKKTQVCHLMNAISVGFARPNCGTFLTALPLQSRNSSRVPKAPAKFFLHAINTLLVLI